MSTHRVVWSEGMFLHPQHFQQQDRHFHHVLKETHWQSNPYGWGFSELKLDTDLLRQGKVCVRAARGILPDGHCINIPQADEQPPILDIAAGTRNTVVSLALPRHRGGGENYRFEDDNTLARYLVHAAGITDEVNPSADEMKLEVAKPVLSLVTDTVDTSGFAELPIARIIEKREDNWVLLDDKFIPPCLDANVSERLASFQSELTGLIQHRAEELASRVSDSTTISGSEFANYLQLVTLNRYVPLISHYESQGLVHPHDLFTLYLSLAAELSTFTSATKRPPLYPVYRHDDLQNSFAPIINDLQNSLDTVIEQDAMKLPLVLRNFGVRVSAITDRSLIGKAQFVIAAKAEMESERLRQLFPNVCRVSSVERIRELVNLALPGIKLISLPVSPPQIPFHSGYAYFELDGSSDHWDSINNSGGFAMHVGEGFPGLELEFWAIREK
ncbi:MAG: type VI secretion system baseplate subunit TssK [Pseudomonadota bacterium]